MQKTESYIFIGPENELYKVQHQFGGLPQGTLEIYQDHIDVYVKGKSSAWAFFGLVGAVTYLAAGKGKQAATITYDMVTAYRKPKMRNFILYLNDGNLLFLDGLANKGIIAVTAFLNGKPVV